MNGGPAEGTSGVDGRKIIIMNATAKPSPRHAVGLASQQAQSIAAVSFLGIGFGTTLDPHDYRFIHFKRGRRRRGRRRRRRGLRVGLILVCHGEASQRA